MAIPLIDTLSTRETRFEVALTSFRELPEDPDDSAVELDKLLDQAKLVLNACDEAGVRLDAKSALKHQASEQQKTIKSLTAKVARLEKKSGKTTHGNAKAALDGSANGKCQVVGCGRSIEKWKQHPNWKLCSTCLLKVQTDGKPLKLKDGGTWGKSKDGTNRAAHMAMSVLGEYRKAGVAGLGDSNRQAKKARLLELEWRKDESPNLDSPEPSDDDEGSAHFSEGTEKAIGDLRKKKKLQRLKAVGSSKKVHSNTSGN